MKIWVRPLPSPYFFWIANPTSLFPHFPTFTTAHAPFTVSFKLDRTPHWSLKFSTCVQNSLCSAVKSWPRALIVASVLSPIQVYCLNCGRCIWGVRLVCCEMFVVIVCCLKLAIIWIQCIARTEDCLGCRCRLYVGPIYVCICELVFAQRAMPPFPHVRKCLSVSCWVISAWELLMEKQWNLMKCVP